MSGTDPSADFSITNPVAPATVTPPATVQQSSSVLMSFPFDMQSTPVPSNSYQYLRVVSLVVADSSGKGLDLSQLRFTFRIEQSTLQSPNTADIRVYNLSSNTMQTIKAGGEFTRLRLTAGYPGTIGLIFDGTIVQTKIGRENRTDTFIDLICADGGTAYNFATVNGSISAGHNVDDHLALVMKALKEKNVTQGYVAPLDTTPFPRGRVVYGMARDELNLIAKNNACTWSIQAGVLTMLPYNGVAPGDAVVLRPDTGLISMPQQTLEGINVRMLLNAQVKVNSKIQIDSSLIQQTRINTSYAGAAQNGFIPTIASDGFYRVISINRLGDTRGRDFYNDLICIALGQPVTPALRNKGLG